MPDDREKLHKIDDIKSKLFSKNYKTKIEHRDIFRRLEKREVPDSWKEPDSEPSLGKKIFMKTSFFKKFFIFSAAFFVLALGYAVYTFFIGGNTVSNNNIDISVVGNAFVAGGEPLPLQINITNRNSSALELVDLVMDYPSSSSGSTDNIEHFRQSLGTIPAGAVRSENVSVTLFGAQGSTREIKISIEYRVSGSNAIFVKEEPYDVSINSTPINLSVDAPTEISPNQDLTLNIKTTLNSSAVAPKMLLKIDYPSSFQFTSAKPQPDFGNNVWSLGDLAPGALHSVSVTGKMVDVFDGEQKVFHISTGSQSDTDKSLIGVVFNTMDQTVTIKKPFIEAKLLINGAYQSQYASASNTPIQAQIQWTNNLGTAINNLIIVAKISGNVVDRKSINAQQGVYNSSQNSITWDKNSENDFTQVAPGATGSVSFSLSPLSLFSAGGGLLSNPSIDIQVSISGEQALQGNAINQLNNSEEKIINIISDVGFANKILYYSGPFKNIGLIPPKAEKQTTYTVVWTLSNTANNISKTKITSTLPPWVSFVGPISPQGEDLTYNPSTKEIIWNVGGVPSGTGITGAGREVAFQVALTPSLSQVGTDPVIINDAILTGHDDFANVDVRVNKTALDTNLSNDPSFPPAGDRVVQ